AGNGEHLRTLQGPRWGFSALAATPDGQALLAGRSDAKLALYDWRTGKELGRLDLAPKEKQFTNFGFHLASDGRTTVALVHTGRPPGRIHFLDLTAWRATKHRDHVSDGLFGALSPDTHLMVSFASLHGPITRQQAAGEKAASSEVVGMNVVVHET